VKLAGKHAVVTGSTKGIGLGIARAFIGEGARVVINARTAADCAAVATQLGPRALAFPPTSHVRTTCAGWRATQWPRLTDASTCS
jgi:NAD(P)-dependent dehydrogenase (short-subunit alcohol dehydrogenase family)